VLPDLHRAGVVMEHTPITKQRSKWQPMDLDDLTPDEILGVPVYWWKRSVGDGTLVACVSEEPQGWHLSISYRDRRGHLTRYPTWDEIVNARDAFLPDDVDFVMHLPKAGEYVALHDTCFHLHEHPGRDG
jgi:hypothetical protein